MNEDLLRIIKELVAEEHALAGDGEGPAERAQRRAQIEAQLDQCWDLLRQRQARREFGEDAGGAHARPITQVEDYLQ
jgi:hypothetical protein